MRRINNGIEKKNGAGKIYWISHVLFLKKIPLLPKILMKINRIIFSCDIPYGLDAHPTVIFGHNGLGTVISSKCLIGENTTVMHNVTLGRNMDKKCIHKGKEFSSPIIGKNVYIGAGAIIAGPIIIGDNAKIGASSIVLHDVSSNQVVVGPYAKAIKTIKNN